MLKKVALGGVALVGLVLFLVVSPAFLDCFTTGDSRICVDTPTSYTLYVVGSLMLLSGIGGLFILLQREANTLFQNPTEREPERDL